MAVPEKDWKQSNLRVRWSLYSTKTTKLRGLDSNADYMANVGRQLFSSAGCHNIRIFGSFDLSWLLVA